MRHPLLGPGSLLVAGVFLTLGFIVGEWWREVSHTTVETAANASPAATPATGGPSPAFTAQSAEIIASYMQQPVKRLQIGAGSSRLPGWLNTDIEAGAGLAYLDASKRFPFDDNTFRYITSEHVIEHLAYEEGLVMIAESFRVLEPGGTLRIATPDLRRLIDLFQKNKSDQARAYIAGKLAWHEWPTDSPSEAIIMNLQLSSWGHRFVYDADTLRARLARAGFTNIREFSVNESDDPELRTVEARNEGPYGHVNNYETMVIQAIKPAK